MLCFQPSFESLSFMAMAITEHFTPAVLHRNLGCDSDQRKTLNFVFMGPAFHQIALRNKALLFLTNESSLRCHGHAVSSKKEGEKLFFGGGVSRLAFSV